MNNQQQGYNRQQNNQRQAVNNQRYNNRQQQMNNRQDYSQQQGYSQQAYNQQQQYNNQQVYNQQQYNQQNQAYQNNKKQNKLETIALILGALSIVTLCLGPVFAIPTLILAVISINKSGFNMKNIIALAEVMLSMIIVALFISIVISSDSETTSTAVNNEQTSLEEVVESVPTESKPISNDNAPKMIDVTNEEYNNAKGLINSAFAELNLTFVKEEIYSDDVLEGKVVKTVPEAGEALQKDSKVTIYVSEGKEIIMPNILGLTVEQATQAVAEIGYELNITKEYSEQEMDTIIYSEHPAGYTLNNTYSNIIDVTVSKGTIEQEIQYLKDNAQTVSYEELLRSPTKYEDIPIKLSVKISKLEESTIFGVSYATTIWGVYNGETVTITDDRETKEPGLLEGDNVTIYGYGNGTSTINVKQKEYQGSLVFGFSYDKTVDTYKVPDISMLHVEF